MATIEQEIRDLVEGTKLLIGGRPRKIMGEDEHFNDAVDQPIAVELEIGDSHPGLAEETVTQARMRRERNVQIALDRFGFGVMFWPTLDDLADAHPGIETKERVRQILNKTVFGRFGKEPLPAAKAVAELVSTRDVWREFELLIELAEAGIVTNLYYFKGLLEYVQAQGLLKDWQVVRPDLREATRQGYRELGPCLVMTNYQRERLAEPLMRAQKIVGQNGLCRLSHIGAAPDDQSHLLTILDAHADAWVSQHAGEYWYTFDGRQNTLVGYARKIFSLVPNCELRSLAAILRNALDARSSEFKDYPHSDLIERWIMRSDRFKVDGNLVSFNGAPEKLLPIEKTLVAILRDRGPQPITEIKDSLIAKGHGEANCAKTAYYSPLLWVDRSGGRKKFLATLVTDLSTPETVEQDDYAIFKARLAALEATDKATDGTARREQHILTEWIFRGATKGRCAICDREFGKGALVTAHKKKRRSCSEAERRDPHIVFPLCVFGCDHLYERGFVKVVDGKVASGRTPVGTTEKDVVSKLVGRELDSRWRAGPDDYFDMMPDNMDDNEPGAANDVAVA